MRCFCCDVVLEAPQPDGKTGRYYCSSCFQPTEDVVFYNNQKDLEKFLGNFSYEAPEIDEPIDTETLPEYNEYQSGEEDE